MLRETRISLEGRFDFRSINLVKSGGLERYSILRDGWGEREVGNGRPARKEVFNSLKFPVSWHETGLLEVIVPRGYCFSRKETLRCNCCCKLSAISSRVIALLLLKVAFSVTGFSANFFAALTFEPPRFRLLNGGLKNCRSPAHIILANFVAWIVGFESIVKNSDKRYVESKFFIIVTHFFFLDFLGNYSTTICYFFSFYDKKYRAVSKNWKFHFNSKKIQLLYFQMDNNSEIVSTISFSNLEQSRIQKLLQIL